MSAPAVGVSVERPTLRIRGTAYPVLLPTLRDPRLHLAAVIVSLQVLGQVAFGFSLSIAQILVSLATCAVLEFAIAFRRQRVIMWPASALLTGNGVAFVLRVPGTAHGDWWSLRGWWIFAGTAAVSILSKHVIRFRGRHLFNPSNFGLVLCFLALGKNRADPLDFWWAPMSTWMALALVIIVAGGLFILLRLHLLGIAVGFWLAFAAGIGVLALSDHAMTARWHLGEITGGYFWRILVFSPEVLVFLFFMITDPKTIPDGRGARRAYAVGVGLLGALLIAPQRTEFGSKVALLGALAIVCAAVPMLRLLRSSLSRPLPSWPSRRAAGAVALVASAGFAGLLVVAGLPARSSAGAAISPPLAAGRVPTIRIGKSKGVASQLDRPTATLIARSVVADLRIEADALRQRTAARLTSSSGGDRLAALRSQVKGAAGRDIVVPTYSVERARISLEPGVGQEPPVIVAALAGTMQLTTYHGSPAMVAGRAAPVPFQRTFLLTFAGEGRYVITGVRSSASPAGSGSGAATPKPAKVAPPSPAVVAGFSSVHLHDVAKQVGLDFRQGDFRFGMSRDAQSMMGGGLCWLDYNNDGWMDLFVVNSYSESDITQWDKRGGLPTSALFENVHGKFVDVARSSGAGLAVRGNGCVAADFNGDGYTDLFVTTNDSDQLLWNNGNGTFSEGARSSGVVSFGWRTGAAVADANGDGRPDLFVAGYTEANGPIPSSAAGFPTNHLGVRDLLFLNEGLAQNGHSRFREVGEQAGLDKQIEHGLGAVFTDVNGDGRPDLYVANDEDPNRLYLDVPWPGGAAADPKGLGFRLVETARKNGVADTNAGMGVARADFNGDDVADLFVSNSRDQQHAVFRGRRAGGSLFANARPGFTAAFGRHYAGWGASWVDLNRDGYPDLVLANGDIPVTGLAKDAGPIQVLDNLAAQGRAGQFGDATGLLGLSRGPLVDGRGLAAADFNNDGNIDVAINTIGGPLILLENTNTAGHWLEVSLAGFHPGAVVTAVLPDGRTLVREEQAGSSYLSSEDPRIFFGLGTAATVSRLLVRYPDGSEKRLTDVAANQIVHAG